MFHSRGPGVCLQGAGSAAHLTSLTPLHLPSAIVLAPPPHPEFSLGSSLTEMLPSMLMWGATIRGCPFLDRQLFFSVLCVIPLYLASDLVMSVD